MERNAYDKAVDLLALREHTGKELEAKLLSKGFGKEESEEAIARLYREGFLSEERFAEVFVRSRLRKTAEGKPLLLMRLQEKGCPRDIAQRAVEEAWEKGEYKESLAAQYRKYLGKKGDEYAVGKLREKGFSFREIQKAKGEEE